MVGETILWIRAGRGTTTMNQRGNPEHLGALLRERRYLLSASIDELSEETGVSAKHLRRIEKGQWHLLPSAVYTQGFVRKYARALGMDADRAVTRYREESGASATSDAHHKSVATPQNKTARTIIHSLTAKVTRRVAVVGIFVAVLGYIGYQLSVVFAQPALTVTEPAQEEVVVEEGTVELAGVTEPGVSLSLNTQRLDVEPDGTFHRTIELLPGINTLEIVAESRFGERTRVSRTVIYREPEEVFFPIVEPEEPRSGTTTPATPTSTTTTSTSTSQ